MNLIPLEVHQPLMNEVLFRFSWTYSIGERLIEYRGPGLGDGQGVEAYSGSVVGG
jgi:hypothetical protein